MLIFADSVCMLFFKSQCLGHLLDFVKEEIVRIMNNCGCETPAYYLLMPLMVTERTRHFVSDFSFN